MDGFLKPLSLHIGPLIFGDGPTLQGPTNKRGRRKRGLWPDEDSAPQSKERGSETPDLQLGAPVSYSTSLTVSPRAGAHQHR